MTKLWQLSPGDILHCLDWQDVLQRVVGTLAEPVTSLQERGMHLVWRLFTEAQAVSPVQAAEVYVAVATQCLRLHADLAQHTGPLETLYVYPELHCLLLCLPEHCCCACLNTAVVPA